MDFTDVLSQPKNRVPHRNLIAGDNQNLKLEAVTTLFEVMVVHLQQIQRSLNKDGWVVLKICLKQRAYGEKERPKREPKHYNNMRKWQNGEMDSV